MPLVGHIARDLHARLPGHVSRDELISAGLLALVASARSFDPSRGVPFVRYAGTRIRGALIDELRSMDWATRSVRAHARDIEAVTTALAGALRRSPRADEIASAMGISVGELDALQCDVARARTVSLHGFLPETGPELVPEPSAGPEALLLARERLGYLHEAIERLPERLRAVVLGSFFEHRTMAEIGAELGVTESRVSQLRSEALTLLKDALRVQLDGAPIDHGPARSRRASGRRDYLAGLVGHGSLGARLARTTPLGDVRPNDMRPGDGAGGSAPSPQLLPATG